MKAKILEPVLREHPPSKFRTDIQALRGFAVLIVLFYHAKIGPLKAGFLGVDVFFVISGFLITRLVKESIERGDFSFADFYFRRAKRILPASYVTFLCTALLAPFFLASSEFHDLRSQMAGAVAFMSNIVLWRQSGYFDGASTLKPLLHIWSLSIEEQYYFFLPALMVFIPRRYWKQVAILLLASSLALCLYFVQRKSSATFFLLPTRGWEIAFGSVGALIIVGDRLERLLKLAFWPALAVLLTLPMVKIAHFHPGPDALLICIATLVIILRKHPLLFQGPVLHGLDRVGNISYSLYLVHWPLFAFLNNSWLGKDAPPFTLRFGLLLLSLILALLMNRYIEEPFRRADFKLSRRVLACTVATSLILVMLPLGITQAVATSKDYAQIRRSNYGFNRDCSFAADFKSIAECRNSEQPEMLIWGDSFAMHLVPGILGTKDGAPSIIQATRSSCAALLGIAQTNEKNNQKWAVSCIDFNDSVMKYLATADSVQTVVLSSPFTQFFSEDSKLLKKDRITGSYHRLVSSKDEAISGMKKTVDSVRALGKRIVVVAPPPSNGIDIGRCLDRSENNLPIIGSDLNCRQISIDSWRKEREPVLEFLAALPEQAGVDVIYPSDYLCSSGNCITYIDDTFIYRDGGHLSYDGSVFLADKMGLVEKIRGLAR